MSFFPFSCAFSSDMLFSLCVSLISLGQGKGCYWQEELWRFFVPFPPPISIPWFTLKESALFGTAGFSFSFLSTFRSESYLQVRNSTCVFLTFWFTHFFFRPRNRCDLLISGRASRPIFWEVWELLFLFNTRCRDPLSPSTIVGDR